MKTMYKTICMVLVAAAVLTGCSKDDDGGSGGTAAAGTVKAKVDGANFTSMEVTSAASETTVAGSTTITLQGSSTDGNAISIIINGFDGIGTYEISDSNVFVNATYLEANINDPMNSQTWSAPFQDSGVTGEIKVSEKTDTGIKGTFNFTAKNANDNSMKEITDGSFNLDFM